MYLIEHLSTIVWNNLKLHLFLESIWNWYMLNFRGFSSFEVLPKKNYKITKNTQTKWL